MEEAARQLEKIKKVQEKQKFVFLNLFGVGRDNRARTDDLCNVTAAL